MSLNTAQLEYLAYKGMTLADAVELSRLGDSRLDPTAAERQQRRRDKVKNERDASRRDVTRDPLDKERSPTPPKEIKPLPPVSPNGDTPPTLEILIEEKRPAAEQETDRLRPDDVVEAWNDLATDCGLAKIAKLTDQRRKQLDRRLRENTFDEFAEALRAIRRSKFCHGENERGWKADFDFLLQPKSFTRLLEGFYDGALN